jgi:hypothetical protein
MSRTVTERGRCPRHRTRSGRRSRRLVQARCADDDIYSYEIWPCMLYLLSAALPRVYGICNWPLIHAFTFRHDNRSVSWKIAERDRAVEANLRMSSPSNWDVDVDGYRDSLKRDGLKIRKHQLVHQSLTQRICYEPLNLPYISQYMCV